MGLHVGQLTSRDAMRFCFDAVTEAPARIMELDGYGLAVGCNADMVVLQAADPIEAIRLKAPRLAVIRRGKVIAETPAAGRRRSTCRAAGDGRSGRLRAEGCDNECTAIPRP